MIGFKFVNLSLHEFHFANRYCFQLKLGFKLNVSVKTYFEGNQTYHQNHKWKEVKWKPKLTS